MDPQAAALYGAGVMPGIIFSNALAGIPPTGLWGAPLGAPLPGLTISPLAPPFSLPNHRLLLSIPGSAAGPAQAAGRDDGIKREAAAHQGKQEKPSSSEGAAPASNGDRESPRHLPPHGLLVQGYPSAPNLVALATMGHNTLSSLHSSVTALPLLDAATGAAIAATASQPCSPLQQNATGELGPAQMHLGSSTNLAALAKSPARAARPAVALNIAPLDTGLGGMDTEGADAAPQPTGRMRKNSSCTSLPPSTLPREEAEQAGGWRAGVGGSSTNLAHMGQVLPPRLGSAPSLPRISSKRSLQQLQRESSMDPEGPNSPDGMEDAEWSGRPGRRSSSRTDGSRGTKARATGRSAAGGGAGVMSRISSLQALVEVAAAAAEDGEGGMPASGDMDDEILDAQTAGMDEHELKRLKRKQSNRESARRSRLKKQAEADALTRATQDLQADNSRLRAALNASQGFVSKLVQEKRDLIEQVHKLGGEVGPNMDWQVPVLGSPVVSMP